MTTDAPPPPKRLTAFEWFTFVVIALPTVLFALYMLLLLTGGALGVLGADDY